MATFACRLTLDRPRIVERDDGLEPTVGVLALDDFLITFYHYLGEFHTVPSEWFQIGTMYVLMLRKEVKARTIPVYYRSILGVT